jgi:hypothetical protein
VIPLHVYSREHGAYAFDVTVEEALGKRRTIRRPVKTHDGGQVSLICCAWRPEARQQAVALMARHNAITGQHIEIRVRKIRAWDFVRGYGYQVQWKEMS